MKPTMIFLDSETGGIGIDKSLLTFCFIVTDNDFNKIDELNLALKPEDGTYKCTAEALNINKIDLIKHDKTAITYKEGGTKLYNFLKYHSNEGKIKLIPVGHGMAGDLDNIFDKLIARKTWETFVSYRRLDTAGVAQFLRFSKVLNDSISGSLESLVEYFGIKKEILHDARGDTLMTINVLKEMTKLVKR
jgi:hypothetical protein